MNFDNMEELKPKRKYTKTAKALASYERRRGVPHGHKTSNGGGWKHSEETKRKMGGAVNKELHKNLTFRAKKGCKPFYVVKKGHMLGRKWSPGRRAWNYIEDRTQLARYKNGNEYRNSPLHREWSRQVKNRDGWKCQISNGDCSGKVVSHHILPWRDYPELRYEIKNGITLCHHHHPRKKEDELRLTPFFQDMVLTKK